MNKHILTGELVQGFRKVVLQNPEMLKGQNMNILAPALGFRTRAALRSWLAACGVLEHVS